MISILEDQIELRLRNNDIKPIKMQTSFDNIAYFFSVDASTKRSLFQRPRLARVRFLPKSTNYIGNTTTVAFF